MATAPIDLCHKLIALATNNPNEEEAKLAALKAVRLIKEHNLLPGAPPVARRPTQAPPPPSRAQAAPEYGPPPTRDPYGDYIYHDYDIMNEVFRGRKRNPKGATHYPPPNSVYQKGSDWVDQKGHDWTLGNTCKNCKMPRELFDRSGMTCHGHS